MPTQGRNPSLNNPDKLESYQVFTWINIWLICNQLVVNTQGQAWGHTHTSTHARACTHTHTHTHPMIISPSSQRCFSNKTAFLQMGGTYCLSPSQRTARHRSQQLFFRPGFAFLTQTPLKSFPENCTYMDWVTWITLTRNHCLQLQRHPEPHEEPCALQAKHCYSRSSPNKALDM